MDIVAERCRLFHALTQYQTIVYLRRSLRSTAHVFASRQHKKEQAIWQRRFWEHRIRDQEDFNRHVDYIHYNPVKYGYVSRPGDWPYSSIHRYIRQGILASDWAASPIAMPEGIGHE